MGKGLCISLIGVIMKKSSLAGIGLAFMLGLATSAFAADACNDNMGHSGNGTQVSGNKVGSIGGTPWGYEQWYQGGNASMTYYSNGTFKANWSGSSDYLTRVGYQYNGNGIDHKSKNFAVDYKYTTTGSAQYGYIGVYGWTKNPETEYYIVDDWYSKPSENYVGEKFGEITVDNCELEDSSTALDDSTAELEEPAELEDPSSVLLLVKSI